MEFFWPSYVATASVSLYLAREANCHELILEQLFRANCCLMESTVNLVCPDILQFLSFDYHYDIIFIIMMETTLMPLDLSLPMLDYVLY